MNQFERIRLYRLNNCVDHVFAYYSEQDKIQVIKEQEQENAYLNELEQFDYEFELAVKAHDNPNSSYKLFI
jgi:hypothetical protein